MIIAPKVTSDGRRNTGAGRASGRVRWQVLAVSAMFSGLICAGAWLWHDGDGDTPPARARTAAVSHAVVPAVPTSAAPAMAADSLQGRRPTPDLVEVCGLGTVPPTAQDPDGSGRIPGASRKRAEQTGFASMAVSKDGPVQAAGLLLQSRAALGDAGQADATVERLAQMARQTSDPLVYAAALEACGAQREGPPPASCGALSLQQWARLEPTNAAPWLRLAQEAQANGDRSALAEAAYQVSHADRINWHASDIAALAMHALPAANPLEQAVMTQEAWAAQVNWTSPSYQGLTAFCELSGDVNQGQICDAAAKLFVRAGTDAAELKTGIRIGQRLGWDPQHLEDLRLRHDVLSRAAADAPFYSQAYSCASIRELQQWATVQQQRGEFGAAQGVLERAGQALEPAMATMRRTRLQRRVALSE